MSYEILKNRMTSGDPFLRAAALERISALADALEISQTEAEELEAIAKAQGVEVLPDDAMGRLSKVEAAADELTLMMADMIGGAAV